MHFTTSTFLALSSLAASALAAPSYPFTNSTGGDNDVHSSGSDHPKGTSISFVASGASPTATPFSTPVYNSWTYPTGYPTGGSDSINEPYSTSRGIYLNTTRVYSTATYPTDGTDTVFSTPIATSEPTDSACPVETYIPSPPPSCIITGGEIDGRDISNCLIINAKIRTSRIDSSILLNSDVTGSQLTNVAVTGGRITLSTIDSSLLQNATVTQSTLTAVAAQLTDLDTDNLERVNVQVSNLTNSVAKQVAVQVSQVADSNFDGAVLQDSEIQGGAFNLVALSKCDSVKDVKITQANLQNVVITDSEIVGANLQDFTLVNTSAVNALKQAGKAEASL